MHYSKLLLVAMFGALGIQTAGATPTAAEVAELGKTLTPFGAIKAGNKEGTIPEYTGGVCTPPPGYKPLKRDPSGNPNGAPYVDPYAADKPLFRITAADVPKYADKLAEGLKELFRRNPQTFYIDVYPTRRSACFPNWMYENTVKRVKNPKIVGGNVPALDGAYAQIPFPIPKTGHEAMWNTLMHPEPLHTRVDELDSYLVDSSGTISFIARLVLDQSNNYWDNSKTSLPEDKPFWVLRGRNTAPASTVGTEIMRWQYLRPDLRDPPAWSYIPGQRRVRLAPEFSYDGVQTNTGGVQLYDEIYGFDGKMDKFDFKLVGRKEMFVPYNTYKLNGMPIKESAGPKHIKPEVHRFELHRVWVVEATLKPGERHVEKKKISYIDEDSWITLMYEGTDQADKIFHLGLLEAYQAYDKPDVRNSLYVIYDFSKGVYFVGGVTNEPGKSSWVNVPPYPAKFFTAEGMAAGGLR